MTPKRLAQLEAKEKAHDDYLIAIRHLQAQAASVELEARGIREPDLLASIDSDDRWTFAQGYRQALRDIAYAIVAAGQERHDQLVGS